MAPHRKDPCLGSCWEQGLCQWGQVRGLEWVDPDPKDWLPVGDRPTEGQPLKTEPQAKHAWSQQALGEAGRALQGAGPCRQWTQTGVWDGEGAGVCPENPGQQPPAVAATGGDEGAQGRGEAASWTFSTHLHEELDGLGAGGPCRPTGDVLGDHAEGAVHAGVAPTVVLGHEEAGAAQGARACRPSAGAGAGGEHAPGLGCTRRCLRSCSARRRR